MGLFGKACAIAAGAVKRVLASPSEIASAENTE
jgi:hypothetical protein